MTTARMETVGTGRGGGEHEYSRNEGTPTREAPEQVAGQVEGGAATACASGMGAVAATVDPRDVADTDATLAAVEAAARPRTNRVLADATPDGMAAFLAVRAMALRRRPARESAGVLAERLEQHPELARVRYPGLPTGPDHERAAARLPGFGAKLSFEVAGGAGADEHVPPSLLRLSVGCAHVEDLGADVDAELTR
ncbi:PLP-dependent transferase [Actinophytocola sp.]|uniref:PLP-dependent transferase n=1 Tax=Actinophytocola sp. TaxID=1872138 RepID=UPI003899A79B